MHGIFFNLYWSRRKIIIKNANKFKNYELVRFSPHFFCVSLLVLFIFLCNRHYHSLGGKDPSSEDPQSTTTLVYDGSYIWVPGYRHENIDFNHLPDFIFPIINLIATEKIGLNCSKNVGEENHFYCLGILFLVGSRWRLGSMSKALNTKILWIRQKSFLFKSW